MVDPGQTVASLVVDHSECAPVFQRHRIDFCCRGNISIADASAQKGIDCTALVEELAHAIAIRSAERKLDPRALCTDALIAHIVETHHEYLRTTLPFVRSLATKVRQAHGDRNARLLDLEIGVRELADTLLPHLDREEQVLFPALLVDPVDPAAVARELASMHDEHLDVGTLLERVRLTTDDFVPPRWACNSYRTLLAQLEHVEADVLTHVHLENHVLMPRFVDGPRATGRARRASHPYPPFLRGRFERKGVTQ
jgi:regulator of cell morphogenesis and NO signaling